MELKNNIFVVSLTHWDREWRFPFEKTRLLLVEMMDELLDFLDNQSQFKCFHLDGQTILLEDYIQARPENERRIRSFVEQGRLFIGPWFVLPEENQMSGESIVRNFLFGEQIGRKFGGNMKIGYSPTSWGQVSQMPQIMRGFGIESIIFYRGLKTEELNGNYYIWQGPDGSKLFGVYLGDFARVSFFQLVDRRMGFDRTWGQDEHEWSRGGKPFRMCASGSSTPYHFYRPPIGWYPENLVSSFENLENLALGKWDGNYALAMECDDSTGAFVLLPQIISEANRQITNEKIVTHGSLPEFIDNARVEIDENMLPAITGEQRVPQRKGLWTDLYAEVQACRIPTKYANRRAEFLLQRIAEPLATLAWINGSEYPQFALDRAWRLLLQCHAHDSIGGCGRDEVNDDVMYRLRQVEILAGAVTEKAVNEISGKIDSSEYELDQVLVVVFNTLPRSRSAVVFAEIDLAKEKGVHGFSVHDINGDEVSVQVESKEDFLAVFNHPHEVPCRMKSDRWKIYFWADNLPAMGYKIFTVKPASGYLRHTGTMLTDAYTIENEHLQVKVNPNGTANIKHKKTGYELYDQNMFEDRGEVGDYWIGNFPINDKIITSVGCQASISIIENGQLRASIEAVLELSVPFKAALDCTKREEPNSIITIKTVYTLVKGDRFVRIKTTINNTAQDHILRTLFPTNIKSDVVHAHTAFDVVERNISLPDTRDWREPYKPVQPHLNFVDISSAQIGCAVLNRGLPQYEAVDNSSRTIALTLLRAHRAWNSIRLAHYPDQCGTQLQGTFTIEYALMPHEGDWQQAEVLLEAEKFNVEAVTGVAGPGPGNLPLEKSFLDIKGENIELSALKKGQWDNSIIIRLCNYSPEEKNVIITSDFITNSVHATDLMESAIIDSSDFVDNKALICCMPAKKIETIKIDLS